MCVWLTQCKGFIELAGCRCAFYNDSSIDSAAITANVQVNRLSSMAARHNTEYPCTVSLHCIHCILALQKRERMQCRIMNRRCWASAPILFIDTDLLLLWRTSAHEGSDFIDTDLFRIRSICSAWWGENWHFDDFILHLPPDLFFLHQYLTLHTPASFHRRDARTNFCKVLQGSSFGTIWRSLDALFDTNLFVCKWKMEKISCLLTLLILSSANNCQRRRQSCL